MHASTDRKVETHSDVCVRRNRRFATLLAVSVACTLCSGRVAYADTRTVGFENPPYMLGSIDGQDTWAGQTPPGFSIDPSIDQEVTNADAHSGSQSFRMSGFYATGSFSDWPFSPSLVDGAGEPGASDGGFSGGTLQARFTATVYFKSVTAVAQDSHVTLSPDRGDGARMSWIRVSDNLTDPSEFTNDTRQGLSVSFFDYPLPANASDCDGGPSQVDSEGKCFVFHTLATNLDRSTWHRIDVEMEFYFGKGNDVVRVTVDGGTPFRGTSWEDFFENNSNPPNHTATVDSILFRTGGTGEGNAGDGFYFDDLTYTSGACLAATRFVATTGDDSYNDCRDSGSPCRTVQHAVDVACDSDTIMVGAGTYTEQVSIPKSVHVIGVGAGSTTIQAPAVLAGNQDIVTIQGNSVNVELTGCTVSGPGPSGCGSIRAGVEVLDGATANIHDNTIADIRDNPLSGCQNGVGIIVGSSSNSAAATITNNTLTNYQKNGMVVRHAGTNATISDNVVTGVGPTTLIAQNGIQVSDGAVASIDGNQVSGNECNHPTCGPDVVNDFQSAGILLIEAASGTIVSNNTASSNDIGIYNWADGPTSISGNTVHSNRFVGIALDQGDATVNLNDIQSGNYGVLAISFDGSTGNSAGTLTCNRITGTGNGIALIDAQLADGNIPTLTAHNNSIKGNTNGADNPTAATMNAENNWWGCVAGPGNAGCDSVTGNVDFTPFLAAAPPCVNCTQNADCDDGLSCSGTETCNAGSCAAGTPVNCTSLVDQCNDAACTEPSGTCVITPKVNGFGCTDGNVCTPGDTCQNGMCVGTGGADSDGDGYCDGQEIQAGCNPNDSAEIPPQANVYSGGKHNSGGEILLTFRAPSGLTVNPATDPSCTTTAGVCVLGFCMTGKVSDPCLTDSDCNQLAGSCRLVINYAGTPDLTLLYAKLKQSGNISQDLIPAFSPVAPGCTRKVDISLPSGFRRANLRFKATGTTNGKKKKDRDRFKYKE